MGIDLFHLITAFSDSTPPSAGQPIDSCMNGAAPLPWDIQVPIQKLFQNKCMELEVPHTSSVKVSHGVNWRGGGGGRGATHLICKGEPWGELEGEGCHTPHL